MPRSPELRQRLREKVCDSSVPLSNPLFLSHLSFLLVLPRSGVFSFFAGSFFVPVPLSLSPLLAPLAGHNDDEEEDHSSDTTPDGQCQKQKLGERGWR